MKKWLRWPGIIAFLVITGCFVVFLYFFSGRIIKHTIESSGTKAVGAKVELTDADISVFPAGIELTGLQVTDPDNPMKNVVVIGSARLLLDTGSVFLRKLIVNEMTVGGVLFNTERKVSGAITESKRIKAEKTEKTTTPNPSKKWEMPEFDVKDAASVLEKESLSVTKEAEKLKKKITGVTDEYQKKLESLPDKASFEEYKARTKKLKKGKRGFSSLLGKASDAKKLKSDIVNDINSLKKVRHDLQNEIHELKGDTGKLTAQATSDYKRIKNKYAFSPTGLGNMSALIFGQKYSGWVEKGLTWYMKLKPYLKTKDKTKDTSEKKEVETEYVRGKGIDIKYREDHPRPGFLIKKAGVSVQVPAGIIEGLIQNITNEQHISGVPVVFQFSGKSLKGINSVQADGELNRVKPELESDHVTISAAGIQLKAFDLMKSKDLEMKIEKAGVDLDFNATMKGESVDSTMRLVFSSVALSTGDSTSKGRLAVAMEKALLDVKQFSVQGKLSGTQDNYNLNVSSDLDSILKKAVSGIAKQISNEFGKKLKTAIDEKAKQQINDIKKQMGDFKAIENEITQRLDMGNNLLDSMI